MGCDLALRLKELAPQQLAARYKLSAIPDSTEEILIAIAQSRGMLGQGGKPRDEDAALLLIQEFRTGKIGHITMEKPQHHTK